MPNTAQPQVITNPTLAISQQITISSKFVSPFRRYRNRVPRANGAKRGVHSWEHLLTNWWTRVYLAGLHSHAAVPHGTVIEARECERKRGKNIFIDLRLNIAPRAPARIPLRRMSRHGGGAGGWRRRPLIADAVWLTALSGGPPLIAFNSCRAYVVGLE